MKLIAGMVAPEFQTDDVFGNAVSPSSYAGKPLLLAFFRNGACALCNLRVHHLIQRFPAYHAQGLEIVAVFESSRESVLTHVTKQDVPFSIVADPAAALYDLYGVESSEEKVMAPVDERWRNDMIREAQAIGYELTREENSNFFRMPAEFLIGPSGRLRIAFYSSAVGDHIAFDDLDQALMPAA
jgi:peroxiredoxin